MTLNDQVRAIRSSVAVSRATHVVVLRVGGDMAWEALDPVVAADLRIRDGQMVQSLLLDESGRVFADVYVACDGEEFLLLAEGPSAADLEAHLRRHAGGAGDIDVRDESATHELISIDGPYSWELLARLAGPDVVGLPYLTFFHFDAGICYRAGKTGEYGYGVLAHRDAGDALRAELLEQGAGLDGIEAGLDALDHCALENWHFNIRREGREPVTPVELQLQWRLSPRKDYVGSVAVRRLQNDGLPRRLTALAAADPLAVGDALAISGVAVGRIVNAGFSEARGEWVAQALIDIRYAHPGIDAFRAGADGVPARSMTPPVLNNLSLFLSPQIHSYATRHEFTFPGLVRG